MKKMVATLIFGMFLTTGVVLYGQEVNSGVGGGGGENRPVMVGRQFRGGPGGPGMQRGGPRGGGGAVLECPGCRCRIEVVAKSIGSKGGRGGRFMIKGGR